MIWSIGLLQFLYEILTERSVGIFYWTKEKMRYINFMFTSFVEWIYWFSRRSVVVVGKTHVPSHTVDKATLS